MKKYTDNIVTLHENEAARLIEESTTRVRLDEADFAALVAGEEVTKEGVKLILADIGFDRMIDILTKLQDGQ